MYDKLPRFVYMNRERYLINTDYRLFIKFEKEMQGNRTKEVIIKTLSKFYPAFSEIVEKNLLREAIKKFLWFYSCGKEQKQTTSSGKTKVDRIYDYDYDSELIWGAYWDRGIDLTTDNVHWWKFKALWNSLPSDCEFKKVIGYRCYNGKDKDMLELKKLHELPPTEFEISERKRQEEIYNQLKELSSH